MVKGAYHFLTVYAVSAHSRMEILMQDYQSYIDYKSYIKDRITQLRLDKGISEYQLSNELGLNRSYIQAISSGRSMPSMTQFINICDYFDITPAQFFDSSNDDIHNQIFYEIMSRLRSLNTDDLSIILSITKRFQRDYGDNKNKTDNIGIENDNDKGGIKNDKNKKNVRNNINLKDKKKKKSVTT